MILEINEAQIKALLRMQGIDFDIHTVKAIDIDWSNISGEIPAIKVEVENV